MDPVDRILKKKALAFSLIAAGTLGTICKERWHLAGGLLYDGLLIACFCLGLIFWIGSRRMERRGRGGKGNEP